MSLLERHQYVPLDYQLDSSGNLMRKKPLESRIFDLENALNTNSGQMVQQVES